MMIKIYPILTLLILLFAGCESKTGHETLQTEKEDHYVDFKRWSEGRVCDKLLWKCLPESNDTARWQKPLENGLDSFELNKETMSKYDRIGRDWNKRYDDYHAKPHKQGEKEPMLISALDKKFVDRVEAKRFLVEMEQELEKEFPGFWRDIPKKVRYRWIQRAINKAKVFGITSKWPGAMVELCARIGLDFDKDSKWDHITEFIRSDPDNNISPAINYIDWTVFNKTHARTGTRITDWLMRRAIGRLPAPKKPYPRLND